MKGQTRKVVHLEYEGLHYYFGSIAALCDEFGKEKIGIGYSALRRALCTNQNQYENKRCVVRIGVLRTKERGSR